MNDALGVQLLQRRRELLHDAAGIRRRQSSTDRLHMRGKRLRLVLVHHPIDRLIRMDHRSHPQDVRVGDFREDGALERKAMQSAQEVPPNLWRMRPDGRTVGLARHETARKEFLDDNYVAIALIVRGVANCERARSANGTNDTKAIGE